jgi:twitching motility two-component system response regulator PilG
MMRKIQLKNGEGHPPHTPSQLGNIAHSQHTDCSLSPALQTVETSYKPLILAIDDSVTVRKILETCLTREGFDVQCFPDGVEAMRWFAQPQKRIPDLVLLDIGLPKLDGYEVARRLKSKPQFNRTIIIMISRRDGMIDKLKARLVGAKEYLSKPLKTQDLIAVVESYLGVPA